MRFFLPIFYNWILLARIMLTTLKYLYAAYNYLTELLFCFSIDSVGFPGFKVVTMANTAIFHYFSPIVTPFI